MSRIAGTLHRAALRTALVALVALAAPEVARAQDGPTVRAVRADPVTVDEGDVVAFEVDAEHPASMSMRYGWDFGDGTILAPAPTTSGAFAAYRDEGAYTVTVRVEDANGVEAVASTTVTVANVAPEVHALDQRGAALPNAELVFEARAADPGDDVLRYGWDFGDGTVLASEDDRRVARHTYDEPGAFRVTVTVDDGDGGTATRTETVIVGTGLDYAATGAVEIPEGTSVVPSLTAVPVRQDGDAIAFDGDLAAAIASARGAGARRCGSRRAARRSRRRPSWSRGRPRASPGRCGPAMSAAAGGPNASGSGSCGRGSRTSRLRSRGPRS